jgi:hypothetical protein
MFVRGTDIVWVHVYILVSVLVPGVIARLKMNINVMVQFSRYLLCRICRVAVTVLYLCLLIREWFT